MKKNIEKEIRFKAALIYLVSIIGVAIMIIYLNGLRKDVYSQKENIENQHNILYLTNELVYAVNEAQSQSGLYLLTKSRKYNDSYHQTIHKIDSLINAIIDIHPSDEENLRRIETLLVDQYENIAKLNKLLRVSNPVKDISEKLKKYEQPLKNDTVVLSVKKDTLITQAPRKGFMRRLGEVFKPSKDSSKIIITERIDTIRSSPLKDSLNIIYENVEDVTLKAGIAYEKSIKNIERQVNAMVNADMEISAEISLFLLQFHKQTLDTTLSIIEDSETAIDLNYKYLMAGGVLLLILILIFIALIITDVNSGFRARRELEVANDRIRTTMESRHNLLLSVSHDIKSPLNSITGYLELMGNNDNVKSMQHSASHIMSMLENLLEFSSIEQGKLKKYESSFSLHELSEEIYGMMRPLAERKNLNLDFESDEVAVATDQIKIKQLLINLVSNAIKYTSDGDVFFELKYAGNSLHLIVEDTGAGIPEDKISDLFKPFTRIEQNNSLAKGSGLGLFVVKGIVDLLDGKIEYFSQVGEGTKVEVVLPVALAEKESEKKTLRVKVYDDDEVVLKVVSDMISSLGHLIVTDNPDIIITDMEMGDISGLDILKGAGDVPVVIMTGKADYSREQALCDGFVDYIPKPVTVALLRNIIGEGERFEDSMGTDYKDVVKLFRTSIKDDLARLHKAFDDDDYFAARAICHKMLPMFIQLGYKTDELTRMDLNKNNSYPDWKKDVETILSVKID